MPSEGSKRRVWLVVAPLCGIAYGCGDGIPPECTAPLEEYCARPPHDGACPDLDEWTASWDTGECTPETCGEVSVVTCFNMTASFRAAFGGSGEMVGMHVGSDTPEFCDGASSAIDYGGPLSCIRW